MSIGSFLPLSPREFHILVALSEEPRNGYQVSQRVEENSRGAVRLSPATQYTNLHRLLGKGLVEEVTEASLSRPDGRGQRYWTLTGTGREVLRAEAERMTRDAGLVRGLAK